MGIHWCVVDQVVLSYGGATDPYTPVKQPGMKTYTTRDIVLLRMSSRFWVRFTLEFNRVTQRYIHKCTDKESNRISRDFPLLRK